ncbi:MAG: response regulator [Sphaerochaeta sp.]|jgi:YesN/AraC family two-component response regulator|uniref:response regulator transcription factor n=1 Tax=Sphaerochaeta sp. TaxID=1972642 RepID=UPI002FC629C0
MYRIVLLDDEDFILDGLGQLLAWETYGFEVVASFTKARLALDYLSQNQVDVLISDIKMPDLSGLELLHELKRRSIGVNNILLLSGYAEFSYAQEALKLGVREYLLKPVDRQGLADTLLSIKEELDRFYHVTGGDAPAQPEGYYRTIVETVKAYLEKEYAQATLDQAALLVAMSPNYVSKVFKQETGMKFSDYLQDVKMKKAEKMLRDVNLKIYQISYAVGYDNPKNFTRAFKQYYGLSPWEYREAGNA